MEHDESMKIVEKFKAMKFTPQFETPVSYFVPCFWGNLFFGARVYPCFFGQSCFLSKSLPLQRSNNRIVRRVLTPIMWLVISPTWKNPTLIFKSIETCWPSLDQRCVSFSMIHWFFRAPDSQRGWHRLNAQSDATTSVSWSFWLEPSPKKLCKISFRMWSLSLFSRPILLL